MSRPCPNMAERIADHVLGALGPAESSALLEHIDSCPACAAYLQALQDQQASLDQLAGEVQSDMSARQDNVIAALRNVTVTTQRPFWQGSFLKLAAAAVFVLVVGFLAGRFSAPAVDVEQLRAELTASIEPAIRDKLVEEMDRRWQETMTATFAAFKNDLHRQVRRDLTEFAAQTLMASKTLDDQRTAELVRLIEAARLTDRQRIAAALAHVEQNRLRDRTRLLVMSAPEAVAPERTEN